MRSHNVLFAALLLSINLVCHPGWAAGEITIQKYLISRDVPQSLAVQITGDCYNGNYDGKLFASPDIQQYFAGGFTKRPLEDSTAYAYRSHYDYEDFAVAHHERHYNTKKNKWEEKVTWTVTEHSVYDTLIFYINEEGLVMKCVTADHRDNTRVRDY